MHRVIPIVLLSGLTFTLTLRAADQPDPAALLVGKWSGLATLGNIQAKVVFSFTKDGQGEMCIASHSMPFNYRVVANGKLELAYSDGRGGLANTAFPFRVDHQTLQFELAGSG